ncbi:TPA: hypothetical protein N0F65_007843 [Lagenidium giganteum]|uniref:Uncharacterized protein n=1 Tax=Lagenidium giganteum TaxID=4803 RepID=A0AAV2YZW1_9STRA|nr:TPA: hypothetical protein N0F65_007843 [Lagenidium giganteum]
METPSKRMRFWTIERRLLLLTSLSGAFYLYAYFHYPSLHFQNLPKPVVGLQHAHGFFNMVRWLEAIHDVDEMDAFAVYLQQVNGTDAPPQTQLSLPTSIALVASNDLHVYLSKVALQCGLLLFLYRLQVLSRQRTVPCMCLSVLVFLCWKTAQSCWLELLQPPGQYTAKDTNRSITALKAALLFTLYTVRLGGTAVLYALMGRAYQVHFGLWPSRWKKVPQYLGSKNLVISTLYYATAALCVMAITSQALRSLSEAVFHIEAGALAASLAHFLYVSACGVGTPRAEIS